MHRFSENASVVIVALTSSIALAQERNIALPKFDPTSDAKELARMTVREGFKLDVAVGRLDGARFLECSPTGRLFISRPRSEDIVEVEDRDGDGLFETAHQVVDSLPGVHGMCWHDDALWFSTSSAIYKLSFAADNTPQNVQEIVADLPSGGGHWWRSLLVTDDALYTSIGDSGNITDESATDRQKIWRFSLSGGDKTLWSSGIRNTEKLRLRPGTTEVWGVDHGSDNFGAELGEDQGEKQPVTDYNPPDELNHYEKGNFYGHPFITGLRMPRYEYMERKDILDLAGRTTPPAWTFGAHWAANSFTFIDPSINDATKAFPADFSGDMIVACRGSWNRTSRAGYQVARVLFDKDRSFGGRPFGLQTLVTTLARNASGGESLLARPVDCLQMPDGSILFSSDAPIGRVYRLQWIGTAHPEKKTVETPLDPAK
jgi:glucose/arabinose dehydrogenase